MWIFSTLLALVGSLIHLVNGLTFFSGFSTIFTFFLVAAYLLSTTKKPSIGAGLLAFGISLIYSSVYLWVLQEDIGLISDAFLYDKIADEISAEVPLILQLNPFVFGYIFDIGNDNNGIVYPGFYKLIGIIYTFLKYAQVESIPTQTTLIIGNLSVSAIGYIFFRLLSINDISKTKKWFLWTILISFPYFIELVVWLRKDLFLLMISLLFILATLKKSNLFFIIILLFIIATFRLPQAVTLLTFYIVFFVRSGHSRLSEFFRFGKGALIATAVFASFILLQIIPDIEASSESLDALSGDLQYNVGLSSILLKNEIGVGIYSVIYPLPSISPNSIADFLRSIYSIIQIIIIAIFILDRRVPNKYSIEKNSISFLFIFTLAVSLIACLQSWSNFGFVVFEPRYKLLSLSVVLVFLSFTDYRIPAGSRALRVR